MSYYRRNNGYRKNNRADAPKSPRGRVDVVDQDGQTVSLFWMEATNGRGFCGYREGGCGLKLEQGKNISPWPNVENSWGHQACVVAALKGEPHKYAEAREEQASSDANTTNISTVEVGGGILTAPTFNWARSTYQAIINKWWRKPADEAPACVVLAGPGSGKTTTAKRDAWELALRGWYGVFNKAMREEAAEVMPNTLSVTTLDAFGLRALKQAFPACNRRQMDSGKVRKIINRVFPVDNVTPDTRSRNRRIATLGSNVIDHCRAQMRQGTRADVLWIVDRFRIAVLDPSLLDALIPEVPNILSQCKDSIAKGWYDFGDMSWGPVVHNLKPDAGGHVIVDEAQDTTPAQQALALAAIREGSKVMFVGDPHQSIYGFRGADPQSIPNIISTLKASCGVEVFRLPVSFRCPKLAIALTNKYVRNPEDAVLPADNAIPGVAVLFPSGADWLGTIDPRRSIVLCRRNAPNISAALACLRAGIPAVIRGRDFVSQIKGFLNLCNPEGNEALDVLFHQMDEYLRRESDKVEKLGMSEGALETLTDKITTIRALSEGVENVSGILANLKRLTEAAKDGAPIVFSTIHQAKGLEADWIYINDPASLPASWARDAWEVEQEEHLAYVAYSRTRYALAFVGQGPLCGLPDGYGWSTLEEAQAGDPFKGDTPPAPQPPKGEDGEAQAEDASFPFGANVGNADGEHAQPYGPTPEEEEQASSEQAQQPKLTIHVYTTLDKRGVERTEGKDAIRHVRMEGDRCTGKSGPGCAVSSTPRRLGWEYHVIDKANKLIRQRLNGSVNLPEPPNVPRGRTYDAATPEKWSAIIDAYKAVGFGVSEYYQGAERVLVLEPQAS